MILLDVIRPLREIFDVMKLDKRARHEVIYGGHKQLQRRCDEEGCGAVIIIARFYHV